jgi:hypothetical protein
MASSLNLQRNSEVYMSTVDLAGGDEGADMTPTNTWRVEVLAGYAASQSAATQDITSLESGLNPDRGTQRFNTAINPTEWSFQTYLRPTGVLNAIGDVSANRDPTGNSQPLADWFLWQALLSDAPYSAGLGASSKLQSAWQHGGKFELAARTTSANVAAHNSNMARAKEYNMYVKMDNVVYQVKNATVNEASIDAAIDSIAMTSWSGFGTDFIELTGSPRNEIISVVGGVLNNGTSISGNSHADANTAAHGYHAYARYNVAGATTTSAFIQNRLSSIEVTHQPEGDSADTYTFPVTGLGFTYSNALTYLTPEELAALNSPISQFTGSRTITGNFTAYLRSGSDESAQFLRNISNDTRTSIAQASSANLKIGGATAPFVATYMPATQFNFPTHTVEDIIGISVEFLAQEPTASRGTGSELTLIVSAAS